MECNWANLPHLALWEIFSYLSHSDRLQASSVCHSWRSCLFYPIFWRHLKLDLTGECGVDKASFFARCIPTGCTTTLEIRFPDNLRCMKEAALCLSHSRRSNKLKCVKIYPSQYVKLTDANKSVICSFANTICDLTNKECHLEELDLGYFEALICVLETKTFTEKLPLAKKLRILNLASLKVRDYSTGSLSVEPNLFQQLQNIIGLSIDYRYLSDDLLRELSRPGRAALTSLHAMLQESENNLNKTSNSAWSAFIFANPDCKLHLSIVDYGEAVELLHSHILQPSMPLASLCTYFCGKVNEYALHVLSRWYDRTFQTLRIVDPLYLSLGVSPQSLPPLLSSESGTGDNVDPLVMMAWKCRNLTSVTLIGHQYSDIGVLGIARLQGPKLQELNIPASCVHYECKTNLAREVSQALGRKWRPLRKKQLDRAVTDPEYSWDSYVLQQMSRA